MKRFARLILSALFLSACAHRPGLARAPANTDPALTAELRGVAELYRQEAVAAAFLMSEPDASGERRPTCQVAGPLRRDQVPDYLSVLPTRLDHDFGVPACDEARAAHVSQLAREVREPRVALGPLAVGAVTLGAVCVFSFAFSAAMTMGTSKFYNRKVHRKTPESRRRNQAVAATGGGMAGAVTGILANPLTASGAPAAALGAAILANTGVICSGAGTHVGYLLVPIQ